MFIKDRERERARVCWAPNLNPKLTQYRLIPVQVQGPQILLSQNQPMVELYSYKLGTVHVSLINPGAQGADKIEVITAFLLTEACSLCC